MKGWKWSNGETVTAQDVVFWIHMQQAIGAQDWFDYAPDKPRCQPVEQSPRRP
jgi:peptide/nickel transport system substrate-binding protein